MYCAEMAGSMRTYKILKQRAQRFDADPEVKQMLAERKDARLDPLLADYTRDKALKLRGLAFDAGAIGRKGLVYERLDQLMMEHLLGGRG